MTKPYALYNPVTHVAVPKEPTEKMMVAALEARARNGSFKDMMSAMLAAAPPHVVDDSDTLLNAVTAFESGKAEGFLAGARAMQEAAAKVAREQAVCGCNGEHGACMIDDPPLYIEELIRALDHEKVGAKT